jgi:hypothetical protein
MGTPSRPSALAPVFLGAAGVLALAFAASGAARSPAPRDTPVRHCASFSSQGAAQTYFVSLGGGPRHAIGDLDGDRDGVACEQLSGPYRGFAGFGYNERRNFFYGYARMPSTGAGEFACMTGNEHFPDGPRRLNVYRVRSGSDKPLLRRKYGVGAEANPKTGSLVWKIGARHPRGEYYMAFEERIPLHPYGANECPGFRSRTITVPNSPRGRASRSP